MSDPTTNLGFQKIKRFVVLMLENRSFDHLLGGLNTLDPNIAGLTGTESNRKDPNSPADPQNNAEIKPRRASSFVMTFDPGHEFYDVQLQLFGPLPDTAPDMPPVSNPPAYPAPMSGFVCNALHAIDFSGDEELVMECFEPDQLPVISTLATEFALFNFWHSSLPGPTWPNRFFIHAATSGGLVDSPTTGQILAGFEFANDTIYDRLDDADKSWCIYHDGLPQTAGISSLRDEYINPLTQQFQDFEDFAEDVRNGDLPDYSFIEPRYDTGNNYTDGNSMHPLNDIRQGEKLVKDVYEALRNSRYWQDTMLVITFDEHGGFYDHQSPPPNAVPTGDDSSYARPGISFPFDRLGVRVPALVISAYTAQGTVIGRDPKAPVAIFDHSSVLATVEKKFGLKPLTRRDAAANTLDVAVNLADARTDAPTKLPAPAPGSAVTTLRAPEDIAAADPKAPLSKNQQTMSALALACELAITDSNLHPALLSNHDKLVEQKDAADYIERVEQKIKARRKK